MTRNPTRARAALVWGVLAICVLVPIAAAAQSPLLEWRQPVYIIAGFAGIIALALLLFQPILAARAIPRLSVRGARRLHRSFGGALVLAVIVHVAGLWITSPPDVVDALVFRSPTPFSAWGVIAMWAVFVSACIAAFRRRFHVRVWRNTHKALALIIVTGSIVHAVLIQGTMEPISKALLCALVALATLRLFLKAARRAPP